MDSEFAKKILISYTFLLFEIKIFLVLFFPQICFSKILVSQN